MKLWGILRTKQKIVQDVVQEFEGGRPTDAAGWTPVIGEICASLDLSRPVLLEKHVNELARFSRTIFLPGDFMESVPFDRFEIEIFPEPKKKGN